VEPESVGPQIQSPSGLCLWDQSNVTLTTHHPQQAQHKEAALSRGARPRARAPGVACNGLIARDRWCNGPQLDPSSSFNSEGRLPACQSQPQLSGRINNTEGRRRPCLKLAMMWSGQDCSLSRRGGMEGHVALACVHSPPNLALPPLLYKPFSLFSNPVAFLASFGE
jgi:hypothetical protein